MLSCLQRAEFVRQTLEIVELDVIEGSIVGIPGLFGLSGEQFKRLTIAVELVANPSIIFCGALAVLLSCCCGALSGRLNLTHSRRYAENVTRLELFAVFQCDGMVRCTAAPLRTSHAASCEGTVPFPTALHLQTSRRAA